MFEPSLSFDVSLLAIILGLYVTKNDRNLILILICVLFGHVLLTGEDHQDGGHFENLLSDDTSINDKVDAKSESSFVATDEALGAATVAETSATPVPETHRTSSFQTTVSSGVFDRQLSTPQTNLTSTVFPATSIEANGKLASARGSFFKSLVS